MSYLAEQNVIERFKMWTAEEVRADLQKHRSDMVFVCENLDYNINIGKNELSKLKLY